MDIRSIRQQEAVDSYTGNYWALIKAAPRVGKCKITIDILKKFNIKKVVVCIPRLDIKDSWEKDFTRWGWKGEVVYTTHRSMGKVELGDIVVIDEVHECSPNQLKTIKLMKTDKLLALSGTITKKTEREISDLADIHISYEYSIKQAVEEGILCDYEITIHQVKLDDKKKIYGARTESGKFKILEKAIQKAEEGGKDTFYLYLQQIQVIQNSIGKMEKTKELLDKYKEKRVLCFCGVTAIADQLDRPVYHSKNKEKGILKNFCEGKGKHLVTIKMAQAGLTIVPIHIGLINHMSGSPEEGAQKICRFLGLEFGNPNKKAQIHIVVSDEDFELSRLETALMFFDQGRIKYNE